MPNATLEELDTWVGRETGVSGWVLIDQARIDQFADVTEDWQDIHTDPEKAKNSAFGGTIAHGFLTLSLLSKFAYEVMLTIDGAFTGVNLGFNRVRMIAPVPCGARVRGGFRVKSYEKKSETRIIITYDVTVEIEGAEKPAAVAEWLTMQDLKPAAR